MAEPKLLQQLLQLVELTSSNDSFYQARERIAAWFQETLGVEWATLHTIARSEQRALELAASVGFSAEHEQRNPSMELIPFDTLPGYIQEAFIRGQAIELPDIQASSLVDENADLDEGCTSLSSFPLIAKSSAVGVLGVYSRKRIEFSPEQLRVLDAACLLSANLIDRDRMILEQEDLYEQLEQAKHTDPVTGFFNRRYFNRVLHVEVSRAQRYRRPLSSLMFEIDHFQDLVESYGHGLTEPILLEFSRLLKAASRESDVLCYYSAGRFALLAVETNDLGAAVLGGRLLELLKAKSFSYGSQPVEVTASAGVVSMPHPLIQSMEQMTSAVEQALMVGLQAGGNRLIGYEA